MFQSLWRVPVVVIAIVTIAAVLLGILVFFGRGPNPIEGARPRARLDGRDSPRVELAEEGDRAATGRQDVTRPGGSFLTGKVLGAANEPVREGWIVVTGSNGILRSAAIDGTYEVDSLEDGLYSASVAGLPQFIPYEEEVAVSAPGVQLDIALERARAVSVLVVDRSGNVLNRPKAAQAMIGGGSGYQVLVTRERLGSGFARSVAPRGRTFGLGSWVAAEDEDRLCGDEPCTGVSRIRASPPYWLNLVYGTRVIESRHRREFLDHEVFMVDPATPQPGSVSFRVIDEASLSPLSNSRGYAFVHPDRHTMNAVFSKLDAAGRGQAQGMPPGEWLLSLWVPGYAHRLVPVQVDSGQRADLGDILLAPGGALGGQVVDAAGSGVPARVWCCEASGAQKLVGLHSSLDEEARNDGWFVVANLPLDSSLLVGIDSETWTCSPKIVSASPGSATHVQLTAVQGSTVTFWIDVDSGRMGRLKVFQGQGLVWTKEPRWLSGRVRMDVSLMPGPYHLVLETADGWRVERDFVAQQGAELVVSLDEDGG